MRSVRGVVASALGAMVSGCVVGGALLAGPAQAVASSAGPGGPFAAPAVVSGLSIVTSSVTVSIDGRSFPARVVQPAGSAPGAYPVVAFGHGFTQDVSRYQSVLAAMARRGYIVVAPNSEAGLFPNHGRFADDLARALRWARATLPNAHPSLDAVAGHSMGGGAALVAADRTPAVDSVATLAAAETNPSATVASGGVAVPAVYIVGSQDTVVRPATTRAMYDAKPSPARWASITGGYHCGFLDSSSFGGFGCDTGSITRATQLAKTQQLLGDWLDATLKAAPLPAAPSGVVVESK